MIQDGEYAAWFKTPRGDGTGIVLLANGAITGGDAVLTYSGWYEVHEDHFTATVSTRRHAAGQPSLFGIDEVDIKLTGQLHGTTASCFGTAEQAPELSFRATLIRVQDAPCVPNGTIRDARFVNPSIRQLRQLASRAAIKSR
jgi:hypothetical protein